MSRNTNPLIVTLDAEPDTNAEDLEWLTRQLREELVELDVQADWRPTAKNRTTKAGAGGGVR